jgi:hypothetical protein
MGLLDLVRSQVSIVAGLFTGHCCLKWYLLDRLERVLLFDRVVLLDRAVLFDTYWTGHCYWTCYLTGRVA